MGGSQGKAGGRRPQCLMAAGDEPSPINNSAPAPDQPSQEETTFYSVASVQGAINPSPPPSPRPSPKPSPRAEHGQRRGPLRMLQKHPTITVESPSDADDLDSPVVNHNRVSQRVQQANAELNGNHPSSKGAPVVSPSGRPTAPKSPRLGLFQHFKSGGDRIITAMRSPIMRREPKVPRTPTLDSPETPPGGSGAVSPHNPEPRDSKDSTCSTTSTQSSLRVEGSDHFLRVHRAVSPIIISPGARRRRPNRLRIQPLVRSENSSRRSRSV